MIRIKKGLDLPISGEPDQGIQQAVPATQVALLGGDYIGMKPTMVVKEGDSVKIGQLLFEDKKTPGVRYTAPAAGVVRQINRGHKRALVSLVIDVAEGEEEQFSNFKAHGQEALNKLSGSKVVEHLVESGLWTALRTRPFSKVPALDTTPRAIFVNAMDTQPLALDPAPIIDQASEAFKAGLTVLKALTEGKVYVCCAPNAQIPMVTGVQDARFSGPHPAGLSGTHVHFLEPVGPNKQVWTINYQDVIAFGILFTEGRIETKRVISLAGPQVTEPCAIETRLGANIDALVKGRVFEGENRVISGSVLSGVIAKGPKGYLGRYHQQVSVLREGRERGFIEYLSPGKDKHSASRIYLSSLNPAQKFSFTTTTNGSERAIVPISNYEQIMPLDILPTQLLKALIVGDTDAAVDLGCLELDEEDLALCTYVCPGKYEYGSILRKNLALIEKEG